MSNYASVSGFACHNKQVVVWFESPDGRIESFTFQVEVDQDESPHEVEHYAIPLLLLLRVGWWYLDKGAKLFLLGLALYLGLLWVAVGVTLAYIF